MEYLAARFPILATSGPCEPSNSVHAKLCMKVSARSKVKQVKILQGYTSQPLAVGDRAHPAQLRLDPGLLCVHTIGPPPGYSCYGSDFRWNQGRIETKSVAALRYSGVSQAHRSRSVACMLAQMPHLLVGLILSSMCLRLGSSDCDGPEKSIRRPVDPNVPRSPPPTGT